jgi:hypothetical protein
MTVIQLRWCDIENQPLIFILLLQVLIKWLDFYSHIIKLYDNRIIVY